MFKYSAASVTLAYPSLGVMLTLVPSKDVGRMDDSVRLNLLLSRLPSGGDRHEIGSDVLLKRGQRIPDALAVQLEELRSTPKAPHLANSLKRHSQCCRYFLFIQQRLWGQRR